MTSNLREYQRLAVDSVGRAFRDASSALVVMPTGCHAAGQGILFYDGTVRPVEQVSVGDVLMGPDSAPRTVVNLVRGSGMMYRIVPTKGRPFIVNEDHVLTLVRSNETTKLTRPSRNRGGEIVDVRLADWLNWSKYMKNIHKLFRVGVDFPARPAPLLRPYFAGLFIGDGDTIGRDCVTVRAAHPEVLRECESIAEELGIRMEVQRSKYSSVLICSLIGKELADLIRFCGLYDVPERERFVPDCFRLGSRADRLALLAGLIDSDGSTTRKGYAFVTSSEWLARDFAFIGRSLGFLAAESKITIKGKEYSKVFLSGDCSVVPCRIEYKRASPRLHKKNVLRTGFSVEPVGHGDYYGFTLDGDGRYLLDDFVVTHNSGKTVVFAHAIREHCNGRALVLAHREELIRQNAETIESVLGEPVSVERAEEHAPTGMYKTRVVVASKDSLHPSRLRKFDPSEFGMLVTDEAHHAVAGTYRRIYEHFSGVPHLGVTATPDRLDEAALASIYEVVAFRYEIADAINDGYLVPVMAYRALLHDLDLDGVSTVAGDLNQRELSAQLERDENMSKIASTIVEKSGDRRGLVFCVSVDQAARLAEHFLERVSPGCARWVCGETPPDERRAIFEAHRAGEFRYLVNVGIATEGYDDPGVSLIAIARPTKSRALFAQMVGRGTRPLPGIIDGIGSPADRAAAIAASEKPNMLCIDFTGNSRRHKLACPADVLGGKYSDEDIADAAMRDGDVLRNLRQAHEQRISGAKKLLKEYEQSMSRIVSFVSFALEPDLLFDTPLEPGRERTAAYGLPPTDRQIEVLVKAGFRPEDVQKLSRSECSRIIGEMVWRREAGLCTLKQAKFVRQFGYDPSMMTFEEASRLLDRKFGKRKGVRL